ncbi:hypothetical protein HC752_09915 [Vibrio sp. S9_S30]|uniref:hypothetical protein n=1 Tax=Vibrio sp. S9_S30 TaxID=2720226 RepID=UPI00168198E4|nr:hypothetical protein [Vibrio sp. S9_S30]MBD1557258.1 hypothetical protein [Vibrio sp. S9_S30]
MMKQRTRIIWVPYGYRLKRQRAMKKTVCRQRVPVASLKTSSHRSQPRHKAPKKTAVEAVPHSGGVKNTMEEQ